MAKTYHLQNVCLAVIAGMPFVAMAFVALRLYARKKLATSVGWDDYTIVLATLLSIALIWPSVRFVKMWHFGIHIWDVNPHHLEPNYDDYHVVLLSFNLINTLILPLVKASLIILLLRVSQVLPSIRRALHAIFTFNVGACVVPWCLLIFQCPPQTGNTWKPRVFGGLGCLDRTRTGQLMIFQTSANLLTDLLIFPIPLLLMRTLERTSLRTRAIIAFLFMTSFGVTAIGAAKIYLTYQDRLYNLHADDWTYSIDFCINHAENNVAIIVACVPALRGLIVRWIAPPSRRRDGHDHIEPPECAVVYGGFARDFPPSPSVDARPNHRGRQGKRKECRWPWTVGRIGWASSGISSSGSSRRLASKLLSSLRRSSHADASFLAGWWRAGRAWDVEAPAQTSVVVGVCEDVKRGGRGGVVLTGLDGCGNPSLRELDEMEFITVKSGIL